MRESAIFNRQMDAALAEIILQRIAELLPQRVAELLPQRVAELLPQRLEAEVAKVLPQRVSTEVESLLTQRVQAKFGQLPPDLLKAIDGISDLNRLLDLIVLATNAPTLADFRRDAGV